IDSKLAASQALAVHPDPEVPVHPAAEKNLTYAGSDAELRFQNVTDIDHQIARRPLAGNGEEHDGLVFRVEFRNNGRIHLRRKITLRLRHARLNVLDRSIDVPVQVQFHSDIGLSVAGS